MKKITALHTQYAHQPFLIRPLCTACYVCSYPVALSILNEILNNKFKISLRIDRDFKLYYVK